MILADLGCIYLPTAASTFCVGLFSAFLSSYKEDFEGGEEAYITYVTQAPFVVQTAVSAITVLEKILAIWSTLTDFAMVLWMVHGSVIVCLCARAGYLPEYRPFLGTWIAFMLHVHFLLQLKFKARLTKVS